MAVPAIEKRFAGAGLVLSVCWLCNGGKPQASDPEYWPHGSFAGYARKSKRVDWVQYDQLHTYWKASVGGSNPDQVYRQYVKERGNVPDDPFKKEFRKWVFGSKDFLRRMSELHSATQVLVVFRIWSAALNSDAGSPEHCQLSNTRSKYHLA